MKSESEWKSWLFLYPLLQGLGGVVWWCLLLAVPESRSLFLSETLSERVLLAFWLPDGVVFVGGSLVLAYGLWRQRCWAGPVLYFLTGGIAYVSLYCLSLSLSTQGGWLGTGLMLVCLGLMMLVCLIYTGRCCGKAGDVQDHISTDAG
ncbi:hypothetical protein [Gimesia panareensis]|uniref:hypothetical protein n=1 Tax=Gimesia panareensis TaxID=2527978 RepID=UPI001188CEEC|nr:hypothetical protein [Gimesia panareensis]QDU48073.1 hypothetical protein Pan110_03850 [Gimesia panareensis]